jgi:quercetin dioxygenase-like cupin family protein
MESYNSSVPFEEAPIFFPDLEVRAADRDWYPVPAWDGVFLKDLVTAKDTGGAFSYHLVRVRPHSEVADHDHETQWEWNVVLGGTGSFLIGGRKVPVEVGQTFVTPPQNHHTVSAGDEELALLAIFVPALV